MLAVQAAADSLLGRPRVELAATLGGALTQPVERRTQARKGVAQNDQHAGLRCGRRQRAQRRLVVEVHRRPLARDRPVEPREVARVAGPQYSRVAGRAGPRCGEEVQLLASRRRRRHAGMATEDVEPPGAARPRRADTDEVGRSRGPPRRRRRRIRQAAVDGRPLEAGGGRGAAVPLSNRGIPSRLVMGTANVAVPILAAMAFSSTPQASANSPAETRSPMRERVSRASGTGRLVAPTHPRRAGDSLRGRVC